MSDQELEPLSAHALAMLGAERERPDVPADIPNRVFEHLATSVAIGSGLAAAASGGAGVSGGAPSVATHGLAGLSAKGVVLVAASALIGGGITGAAVQSRLDHPPALSTTMRTAAPSSAMRVPPETPASSPPPMPPPAFSASSKVSEHPPAADNVGKDVTLGIERDLVERARMALARGDATAALDAIDRHAKEFPNGRLAEEREALAVQALVAASRTDSARARAARFRERFPRSVFLPAVESAIGAK